MEIASSLQLSRNILIALLSLQSWKAFMQRWMKAYMNFLDDKVTSTVLDKSSRVANDILKVSHVIGFQFCVFVLHLLIYCIGLTLEYL